MIATTTATTRVLTTRTTIVSMPIWSWIVTVFTISYTVRITIAFISTVPRMWGCTATATTFTTMTSMTTMTITTTATGPPISRS
tara:strand:- start:343 stop:594 length:252 start_codon:yes stop_codon:yes gene_type:complete